MQFKVTFQNGDAVLLDGEDIADAYNRAGYTEADIDAAGEIYEVIYANQHDDAFPLQQCSCPHCQDPMILERIKEKDKFSVRYGKPCYRYICKRCGTTTPKATSELGARIQQNYACLGTTPLTQKEINRIVQLIYHKSFNDTEDDAIDY